MSAEESVPNPGDPVTFIGDVSEAKPVTSAGMRIKDAQTQTAVKPVRVKVTPPYRVVHEGVAFSNGDVLEVSPGTAEAWVKAGWVAPTTARKTSKKAEEK
jgi:hypothetical protein